MTKKEKILKLFNSVEWINTGAEHRVKIITYEHFYNADLNMTIEYGEKWCDVIYARRIIQKMGHRVLVGMQFYVYENKLKALKSKHLKQ